MSKTTPPQLPGNPNYQPQQPAQYVQQVPPQQQVIVQPGYTFGKFCLHVLMFVGLSIVLVLGGCTLLVGGCSVAMQESMKNLDEGDKKQIRQKMEERGHSKGNIDRLMGPAE